MQRRTWDVHTNAMMVIDGFKGKPVAEICTEHHSSQAQDYQWREQCPAHAAKACESHQSTTKEARPERENTRLKPLVGELPWELNTSDERLA